MPGTPRTRPVEKSKFRLYLKRGEEFLRAMHTSMAAGDHMAAGGNGVQCAIALADAVTVAHRGHVAAGQGHEEAAELLRSSGAEGAGERAGQFLRVVELKYKLEYDDRAPTPKEVADLVERVVRLHRWAVGVLPP